MKNYLLFSLLFIIVACQAQTSSQVPADENLDTYIKREADSLFKKSNVPGIFIGVLDNGKRSYYNYGYAIPDLKVPFDSTTVFEIGSITKTFTALLLTVVLGEKQIDENTSIIEYLPDSVKTNKSLGSITFKKLLNHTSGLPRMPTNLNIERDQPYADYDDKALFSYLKTVKPDTTGKIEYSNLGFGLAGLLALRLFDWKSTGKNDIPEHYHTFEEVIGYNIALPLALWTDKNDNSKKAQGYFIEKPVEFWKFQSLGPAGSIKSNTADMLTYLYKIANPPAFKDHINKLLEPTASFGPNMKIGRGWIIAETAGKEPIYWHNGGTYGFSTFGGFLKGQSKAVIVVVNRFNANNVSDQLGMKIMQKLRNQK